MKFEPKIENFTRYVQGANFRFLDAMEDLVRIRDHNGEILFENKSMRDLIENLIIKNKRRLISPQLFLELYEKKKQGKDLLKREVNIDGKLYSINASPIYNDIGDLEGYIEVFRDITSERNTTKQLYIANRKINEDIQMAKKIQKSILPKKKKYKNISFQFAHVPSDNLSGDVFDVIEITKNKFGIYIADVVGHGISASIMTMFIRQSMRSIVQEDENLSPSETIQELKSMFSQLNLDISQYFTIVYMVMDTDKKLLKYVNAGHNCAPILFNSSRLGFLQNCGYFISNLFENVKFNEKELYLNKGDKILIYTDGLTETTNYFGEFFGEDRLVKWIRKNRNEKQFVKKLINEVEIFRYNKQVDDIAILYLELI